MTSSVSKLAILGSTGSIGRQCLSVVEAMPGRFSVLSLAAGANLDADLCALIDLPAMGGCVGTNLPIGWRVDVAPGNRKIWSEPGRRTGRVLGVCAGNCGADFVDEAPVGGGVAGGGD